MHPASVPCQGGAVKRKEKAAETEAALKEAAKRLFADRGYLNTKITDVTTEAGRAAGSFYNHFASKEELLEALLADVSAESDKITTRTGHKGDFSDPDAIRWHVRAFLDLYRKNAPTMRALRQAALVSDTFADTLARFGADEAADVLDHLRGLALPADPRTTFTMMSALVDNFVQQWPAVLPGLSEEDVVEALTRFLYRGFTGKDY
ncbi:TetR/AcrR family transcriptional regulator [Amycolatopsis pithecellobii]|uniref:TetR family transcriptional regulator n=1 Tax=Amycolatopsis pithecellobii TaxID=664692 RepID=A0A6N7YSV2_9PSEU|nr:TetR/AcrR family transcriptional regulator [Amycolatopsis pithecellobii]MTD55018.1 TetR family transcriptional regulator [Amycolatopsis pithecellobii]